MLIDDCLQLHAKVSLSGVDVDDTFFNPTTVVRTTMTDWRARAEEIIAGADVCVFDISLGSGNLVWELSAVLRSLTPKQCLFVSHRAASPKVAERIAEWLPMLAQQSGIGSLKTPLRYGGFGVRSFRFELFKWMRRT